MRRPVLHRLLPSAARAALCAALLGAACYSVPGTGRSQFRLVPLSTEMSLGAQAYGETLGESKTVTTGADAAMVKRVGERIAAAARRLYPEPSDEFDWQIVLLEDPKTVNAWCMPGGKMAVYSGLLPITQDENSLAVVVGHEVGHAVARHGGERMSQEMVFELGLTAASASMSKMAPAQKDQLLQALTGAGQLGVLLPFSRKHENEADELGLFLAADAGYDPQAAIGLWTRMGAA
ncbi:MAG TPA: M48 family metallopeptidase, partial [Planctomycetota bacterium]|nr:M48 family metallopeptidase [Planctomycetota bacterium]